MFIFIISFSASQEHRTLYLSSNEDGNCLSTPCSVKQAKFLIHASDTLIFKDDFNHVIYPTAFPSEISDFLIRASLLNTTIIGNGMVFDGTYLAGDMMMQIISQDFYSWSVFRNITFRSFSKPIAKRKFSWSSAPYLIFKDCNFLDSSSELFVMKGGVILFENCLFKNIQNRIVKGIKELKADFVNCTFENCSSLFFSDSNCAFRNCNFYKMKGERGGAIYASRSTLFADSCKFIDCFANINGGAIYIRESFPKYESEIINSCFINNEAKINSSSIYSYMSYLNLENNCFVDENYIAQYKSKITFSNNTYSNGTECLIKKASKYIEFDYTPIDTLKFNQLDEHISSGTTVVIDDEL